MTTRNDRVRFAPIPTERTLRPAYALTVAILVLAAIAAAAGLFVPSVYRETAWVVPQNRGTDLVTLLIVLPALALALVGARRGDPRAQVMWIGLLGHLTYVYAGAAFAYAFNELFLVYVALISLLVFALVTTAVGTDARAVAAAATGVPRRALAGFLVAFAALLATLWLAQILPFYTSGRLPEILALANAPTNFIYVLDLGAEVPLALLAAAWLWRRRPWGPVLTGVVLTKVAAMGLTLLAMTLFMVRAGQPLDIGLVVVWVALAAAGFGFGGWFLAGLRPGAARP